MFDLSRMTWHSVLGLEMGPCLQYRLPPLLLPWQQSEEMSATPAPTGHLSLRAILNLLSESCTNRSTTCPSLPKRRNSSDRYGSSVLLHSGEKDYTDQLLTLRCFFCFVFLFFACSLKSSTCSRLWLSLGHRSAENIGVHALLVELSRCVEWFDNYDLVYSDSFWLFSFHTFLFVLRKCYLLLLLFVAIKQYFAQSLKVFFFLWEQKCIQHVSKGLT